MASKLSDLLHAAAGFTTDLTRFAFCGFSAKWPHAKIGSTPVPRGRDLDLIGDWMRIPRPMIEGAPASDLIYREILKKPFTFHQSAGTVEGLLAAVRGLGYSDVRYIDFPELLTPPMLQQVSGGPLVLNQNAFGLESSTFPQSFAYGDLEPAEGTPMAALLRVIRAYKRASAMLWELRITDSLVVTEEWAASPDPDNVEFVVTQEWWDGAQDPDGIEFVVTEPG